MNKKYRIFIYLLSISLLCFITWIVTGNILNAFSQFWFSAGILLVILLSLIDQPFFSKDANIFVNAVTASISLLLIPKDNYSWIFWTFLIYVIYLLVSSYILMWVRKNPLNEEKRIVQFISKVNRIIGKPQTLFSLFFLWGAILQFGLYSKEIIPLFWFWVIFLLLNVPSIAKILSLIFEKNKEDITKNIIGNLFGVQGKEIFLVKLLPYDKREKLNLLDPVEFKYKIGNQTKPYRGIVIDNYFLNEEQWIKVFANDEINTYYEKIIPINQINDTYVYKLTVTDQQKNEIIKNFVGIVTENSDIEKIKFIYNNAKLQIMAGQLLEINSFGNKIYYQIINAITRQEQLEAKNETNFIIGEALQLGIWNKEKNRFEKYGWVPAINTPIYLYSNSIITERKDNFYEIGTISESNLPVLMDINTAITHHMAVLGVTGTGKSCFVRNLIKEYHKEKNRKIFVVDITGEHKKLLQNARLLFADGEIELIYDSFNKINTIRDGNYNKDTPESKKINQAIIDKVFQKMTDSINETDYIDIIDLPNVDNNQNMLDFISYCFRSIFTIAKNDLQSHSLPQICILIEEAHTIIPEWNFVVDYKNNKNNPAINAISQIALQGRKYNVGLLIVAQRSATISKTVLTQCNSIVSFQEFDKTTIDYLSNYYGDSIVKTLPNLKFRQAIASGKAFASNVPMIFDVPEYKE